MLAKRPCVPLAILSLGTPLSRRQDDALVCDAAPPSTTAECWRPVCPAMYMRLSIIVMRFYPKGFVLRRASIASAISYTIARLQSRQQ